MKTDRELLEQAARTMGEIEKNLDVNNTLELMSRLKLSVIVASDYVAVTMESSRVICTLRTYDQPVTEKNIRDCVLRAAAELGEAME